MDIFLLPRRSPAERMSARRSISGIFADGPHVLTTTAGLDSLLYSRAYLESFVRRRHCIFSPCEGRLEAFSRVAREKDVRRSFLVVFDRPPLPPRHRPERAAALRLERLGVEFGEAGA